MQYKHHLQISIFLFLLMFLNSTAAFATATSETAVTLREKIGQMVMIGFKGTVLSEHAPIVDALKGQSIGGVILFDYDFQTKQYDRNIKNPSQLKQLTQSLQAYTRSAAYQAGNDLYPLLIGIDYEGGKVNRLKEAYGFPKTLSAAQIGAGSMLQAEEEARNMANTLSDMHINFNFAPVVDLNLNPDNPVIGKINRSFAKDADTVSKFAAIFSKAYQQQHILCAYKHFPGHGSSLGDTHQGFVDVTQTWQPAELAPYKTLFANPHACSAVMVAHVVHKGLDRAGNPATLSFAMTNELLRQQLKFKGLIVTDDLQMKAITDHYPIEQTVRMAINAGADILVFGNQLVPTPQDPEKIINIILADVRAGKISEARIEEAYQRIMHLKKQLKKAKQQHTA